jgi:hypothetical protein
LNEEVEAFTYSSGVLNWFVEILNRIKSIEPESQPPLESLLDRVPLVKDDWVQLNWCGRAYSYRVLETVPKGVVVPDGMTRFSIENATIAPESDAYEDIGGLTREVARVRRNRGNLPPGNYVSH